MHDYRSLKANHGSKVNQTIDTPIMIADFWELGDAFVALFVILIFGVMFYSWGTMFGLLFLVLGVGPLIKKNNNRGIFFHYPYRAFRMSLPGLINPGGKKRYSD
jgi:hypothetical protein